MSPGVVHKYISYKENLPDTQEYLKVKQSGTAGFMRRLIPFYCIYTKREGGGVQKWRQLNRDTEKKQRETQTEKDRERDRQTEIETGRENTGKEKRSMIL